MNKNLDKCPTKYETYLYKDKILMYNNTVKIVFFVLCV